MESRGLSIPPLIGRPAERKRLRKHYSPWVPPIIGQPANNSDITANRGPCAPPVVGWPAAEKSLIENPGPFCSVPSRFVLRCLSGGLSKTAAWPPSENGREGGVANGL